MKLARFPLGRTVANPGALAGLQEAGESPGALLKRQRHRRRGRRGRREVRCNNKTTSDKPRHFPESPFFDPYRFLMRASEHSAAQSRNSSSRLEPLLNRTSRRKAAKLAIYRAFIEGDLEVPKHLARRVHELYFTPQHQEFESRTMWSLSNAFTSAFKELDPIPQFRATARLGRFLEAAIPT
jgi:hypothetical protein